MDWFLSERELPKGFVYPAALGRLVSNGSTELPPWHVMTAAESSHRLGGIRVRYPGNVWIPFASRKDCDDVACFVGASAEVVIIHDFASTGFEIQGRFADFAGWLRSAIEDFLDWD